MTRREIGDSAGSNEALTQASAVLKRLHNKLHESMGRESTAIEEPENLPAELADLPVLQGLPSAETTDKPKSAQELVKLAYEQGKAGDVQSSIKSYEEAVRLRESARSGPDGIDSKEGVQLLMSLGAARGSVRDVDGAIEALARAKNILGAIPGGLMSAEGAELLRNLGFAYGLKENSHEELECYEQALAILGGLGLVNSAPGLRLLRCLGKAREKSQKYSEALEAYERALAVQLAVGKNPSAVTEELNNAISRLKGMAEEHAISKSLPQEQALSPKAQKVAQDAAASGVVSSLLRQASQVESLQEERAAYVQAGTLHTHEGAHLLLRLGAAQGQIEDLNGAIEAFAEAKTAYEVVGMLESAEGVALLSNTAFAQAKLGRQHAAVETYREARGICERLGHLETPAGQKLQRSLEKAEKAAQLLA
eukprot:TRINITY_DN10568_c1_g3_i1.p1 TRINITY_DN10568_c1_g3~~TRINITY_DN10568_c1_g3_i1.p1  ORF type:complete len:458 (+),score=137.90 TRINITY_DN10568_c1_g3_i1:105-1376(+)